MEKSLNNPDQKILLDLLRKLRRDRNLSQADIGERIQKRQTFISKYELGERRLDILELRTVCHAIGISLTDFVSELEKRLGD
jgi:transcriptional regulator with XRE-family HTH domain